MNSTDSVGPETPAFPAPLIHFVRLFNEGQFWESHEVLEVPWRQNRSDFYQGLILVASAYVHAQRGNPVGVRKQMQKAKRRLGPLPAHYLGVDIDALRSKIEDGLVFGSADSSPRGDALIERLAPPRLRLLQALVRGDEPELAEAGDAIAARDATPPAGSSPDRAEGS